MYHQILKFLIVGVTSTIITLVALTVLVEWAKLDPVVSSFLGYSLGAIANYILNFKLTFSTPSPHSTAIPRFILIVLCGLLANTTLMFIGVHVIHIPYIICQLLTVGIVMIWSFVAYKYWAFVS